MLPSLNVLSYKTKLISNGKEIEYRPFLAKEQKILLMALEGGSVDEVTNAVMNILKACVLTNIDVEKLPTFDIQYLFIELRKKSIGDLIDLKMKHPEKDSECDHAQKITIDLNDVQVIHQEGHSRKIKLKDDIGVVMRYPNSSMFEKYTSNNIKNVFGMIVSCIESVYDAEEIYSDFTEEEMTSWVGNLTSEQLQKLIEFFETMPSIKFDINYNCSKCKKDVSHRLDGITDFFT